MYNCVIYIGPQSVILLHNLFRFLHSGPQYFGNSEYNVSLEQVVVLPACLGLLHLVWVANGGGIEG
jgi:hypothetical protein